MQSENESEKVKKGVSGKKVLLWAIFFVCLFILVPFFAIPAYVSSRSGNALIIAKVNSSIPGKVEVDSISMSWFEGIRAENLNYTDNAGTTKVTARQIEARPSYLALIGGKVIIDNAVVDKPDVTIDVPRRDFFTEQTKPSAEKIAAPAGAMQIDRLNLTISNGICKISAPDASQSMQTLEMRDINSKIALRPLGSKSSFDISMAVAGANEVSQVAASGQIKTAQKQWSLQGATGELSIDVNGLELSTLTPLLLLMDPNASAAGKVFASVETKLQKGQLENLKGTVNISNLDVTGSFLKGDRLQSSKFQSDMNLSATERAINISNLNIAADGLTASAKGTVPKTLRSFEDFMNPNSANTLQVQFDCDVAKTFKQVKTLAHFKQNFDINYGRLSGNVNTVTENGQRVLAGKIKLWGLEGKFPIKRIIISKPVELDARISAKNNTINVEKLLVDSSFAKATLSGTTDDMSYNADVDFAKMQYDVGQFFDMNSQLAGTAQLVGKCSLVDNVFASTGSALINNLTIALPQGGTLSEANAAAEYNFQADMNKDLLTAKSADISASFGKISVANLTAPMGQNQQTPLKFSSSFAVDIDKLNNWITILGKTDPNTQYAGFARGDVVFQRTGDVFDIATNKQITIENLKVTSPGKEPFVQQNMTIAFSGKFDTDKKIYDIPQLSIVSPQIKITGNISNAQSGDNIKTQGNVKAEYDLAAASSIILPFVPSGFSATGKRDDTLSFSSVYPKSQPGLFKENLSAKSTWGFDSANYMGLDIGKSEFNVKIENGLMTIAPFTTAVNNGKFNFAGSANLKNTPAMLVTPAPAKMFDKIQITQKTSDAVLGYMNPVFANAVQVTGVLSFDCDKMAVPLQSGYGNSIDIAGTVSIDNMHLRGSSLLPQIIQITGGSSDPTITLLPTKFTVSNGVIRYDNMQMNIDQTPVVFSGKIGLNKSMKMNITLPWQRNGQNIVLPLKGTVDKPQIDLGKLIEQQGRQELENQLQKVLEKKSKKK